LFEITALLTVLEERFGVDGRNSQVELQLSSCR
jgi:hypothetical protein